MPISNVRTWQATTYGCGLSTMLAFLHEKTMPRREFQQRCKATVVRQRIRRTLASRKLPRIPMLRYSPSPFHRNLPWRSVRRFASHGSGLGKSNPACFTSFPCKRRARPAFLRRPSRVRKRRPALLAQGEWSTRTTGVCRDVLRHSRDARTHTWHLAWFLFADRPRH
jgi:hypothetical protein